MQKSTEMTLYKRGKGLIAQSLLLAFVIMISCTIGIVISKQEAEKEEQKAQMQMVLKEHLNKVELQKMTEQYKELKAEMEQAIADAALVKKNVTPTSVSYTSRGTRVDRTAVTTQDVKEVETAKPSIGVLEEEAAETVAPTSSGAPTEYKQVIEMKATAYCLCTKCCGKSPSSPNYGVTSSGLKIVPGTGMKVIAVDPKVIPLGSKVYVEGLNGAADYGYAVAADTGSAIKNNKIDVYMDTHSAALNWGRKSVKVYVVE
ncbi:3D domain-containing protein, partial [bacterium]|nr:3D domain-containing protein [Clostridia bacterium]MBR1373530.1 3D domain-containing protein [bacterium]